MLQHSLAVRLQCAPVHSESIRGNRIAVATVFLLAWINKLSKMTEWGTVVCREVPIKSYYLRDCFKEGEIHTGLVPS